MSATPAAFVQHENSEGVLCWGGPNHGEVVPLPNEPATTWRFPLQHRPHPSDVDAPLSPALSSPSVTYDMKEFGCNYGTGGEVWPVLVYQENRERLALELERQANVIFWMTDPHRYSPPDRGEKP